MSSISGPPAAALSSLRADQVAFIRVLPKAELHAHLNGSIPIATLQELAEKRSSQLSLETSDAVQTGLATLKQGVSLNAIGDFFGLFPAIYAITSSPTALRRVTSDVLKLFLDEQRDSEGSVVPAECTYLELRSTPRTTSEMTRKQYLEAVLDEVERYPAERAALIVSVDRRMSVQDAHECVDLALALRKEGRRVVGVDLCGDPMAGDMKDFHPVFKKVKDGGLGLTLHIAEVISKDVEPDTDVLLATSPSRLGHATFLTTAEQDYVRENKIPIEICLTSNLLCKTVPRLEDHHIHSYLREEHPIAICTDDTLPFRTSLTAEYALLIAEPPLGLGLTNSQVEKIAAMGMASRFT